MDFEVWPFILLLQTKDNSQVENRVARARRARHHPSNVG